MFNIWHFCKFNSDIHSTQLEPFKRVVKDTPIRRMFIGDNLDDVLGPEGNAVIPLFLPELFWTFANDLITLSLGERGLPSSQPPLTNGFKRTMPELSSLSFTGIPLNLAFGRIDSISAWQLIDRWIDEWVLNINNKTSFLRSSSIVAESTKSFGRSKCPTLSSSRMNLTDYGFWLRIS